MTPSSAATTESNQHLARRLRRWLDRLGPLAGVAMLVSAAVVGATMYTLQLDPLARAAAAMRRHDAARLEARFQDLGGQIERMLLTSAAWSRLGAIRAEDAAGFNRIMIPVIESRPLISSVHLASDDGREILLLRTSDGWKNRLTDVPVRGQRQHWLSWQDATTPSGQEWKEADYDPRRRPWFSGALATPAGQVHWTAPYLFQTTKEPGITASVHYVDPGTRRRVVVAFDVLLNDLSRITGELRYGPRGQVVLLTDDGKLLGLPRDSGLDAEAARRAVLRPPDDALPLVAAALRALGGEAEAPLPDGEFRFQSPLDQGAWVGLSYGLALRNQAFRVLALAPAEDFAAWTGSLGLALGLLLMATIVFAAVISRLLAREISRPLGQVFDALDASNATLAAQIRRASALNALSPALQAADDFASLGRALFAGLAEHLPLGQASLYRADPAQRELRLCAGYARLGGVSPSPSLAYGEGLVGQCAESARAVHLAAPPPDYARVGSALAAGPGAELRVVPVINHDTVAGVLELIPLRALSDEELALLDAVIPLLALCLEILARNGDAQALLAATRNQAAELETQRERVAALLQEQRTIFDNVPMGILYVSDGVVLRANGEAAWLLGRSEADLIGQAVSGIFPNQANYSLFDQAVGERLAQGASLKQEWEWGGGSGRWLMLSIQQMATVDRTRAAIWTIEDVTERRRADPATGPAPDSVAATVDASDAALGSGASPANGERQ